MAAILALCILAYDAGLKHTWLGPVFMGACRGLNLLLGMSHAQALAGPIAWFAAVAYGLFVAGITVVSRSETSGGIRGGLRGRPGAPGPGSPRLGRRRPGPSPLPAARSRPTAHPAGRTPVLALVALAVNSTAARAIKRARSLELIQKTVKTGILTLVWLHVGVVAGVRGLEPAALRRAPLGAGLHPGPVALFDLRSVDAIGCDSMRRLAFAGRSCEIIESD